MASEIAFPVEFQVAGTPVSLQSSARSKARWKALIVAAAKARLPEHAWASDAPIAVTIYLFSGRFPSADLDNIIKPILDALGRLIYRDDNQVDRLLVERLEVAADRRFVAASVELARALVREPPCAYIRVDDHLSRRAP